MDAEAQLLEVCNELLIKIRETPENKKCFDCSDTNSPRYVCTDYSTLVCSCCANIHMEFAHSIKCLNLFAFTLNEILSLRDSGNKLAAYKWLATWSPEDFPEPDPTSLNYKENARAYIKAKYVEKRWARDIVNNESTNIDAPEEWNNHLHDEKVPSPHLSHRANFAANNPFISSSSPSSPYISTPSRMSFPPQNGYSPAVTIDFHQYSKLPRTTSPAQTSPSHSNKYNPFEELDAAPHNNKELLRSRTLLDLNAFTKTPIEDTVEDDTFKPNVRIRSASAHALLHCGSESNIVRAGGKAVILPSGQEIKFPSKALPPRPDEKKEVAPIAPASPAPTTSVSPASPVSETKEEIGSPRSASAKDLKEQPEKSTILKSPLKINTLVKALTLKVNSPSSDGAPTSPREGEQPIGESPEKQQASGSTKMSGIMNKMSSLLAAKKPSVLKL